MRTMKRVAAVALSVVVLMTSGVSAKAAVTDVQPAKSSSEAVLKWAKKVGEPFDEKTYANNTVSKIKLVGNYLYVADDAKHRIMKIDKKDGTILKEQKYYDLGMPYADTQWELPTDATPEEKEECREKVYSWQTRLWIDDMFMITIVQSQAYRVTGEKKIY